MSIKGRMCSAAVLRWCSFGIGQCLPRKHSLPHYTIIQQPELLKKAGLCICRFACWNLIFKGWKKTCWCLSNFLFIYFFWWAYSLIYSFLSTLVFAVLSILRCFSGHHVCVYWSYHSYHPVSSSRYHMSLTFHISSLCIFCVWLQIWGD